MQSQKCGLQTLNQYHMCLSREKNAGMQYVKFTKQTVIVHQNVQNVLTFFFHLENKIK